MLENYQNDVLNIDELCTILRIGRNSAYKLLQNQTIPNRKLQRKYIIPKDSVIRFMEECENKIEKEI